MTEQRTTKEILEAALAIIEDPAKWTQGAYARHKNGNPIGPMEDAACRWCVLGALLKAGDDFRSVKGLWTLNYVSMTHFKKAPHDVNDEGTHADVVEMFKRAIAVCDGEAA